MIDMMISTIIKDRVDQYLSMRQVLGQELEGIASQNYTARNALESRMSELRYLSILLDSQASYDEWFLKAIIVVIQGRLAYSKNLVVGGWVYANHREEILEMVLDDLEELYSVSQVGNHGIPDWCHREIIVCLNEAV